MKGYLEVHYALNQFNGKATGYDCIACGNQAKEWAFQHNAEETFIAANGRPYSPDLECYAPMCNYCHQVLDRGHGFFSEIGRKGGAAGWALARLDPEREYAAKKGIRAMRAKLTTDVLSAAGSKSGFTKWFCSACGYTNNGGAVGTHQKMTGHAGRERLSDII